MPSSGVGVLAELVVKKDSSGITIIPTLEELRQGESCILRVSPPNRLKLFLRG